MSEYSESKNTLNDLYLIRKIFEQYMGREMEEIKYVVKCDAVNFGHIFYLC